MFRKKNQKFKNMRRSKRLKADYLIKYEIVDDPNADPEMFNIRDISATGLRFVSNKFIAEGTKLKVSAYVPPIGRIIQAHANVIRTREASGTSLFFVGVHFIDLKKEDSEDLNDFIEKLAKNPDAHYMVDHDEEIEPEPNPNPNSL